MLFSSPLLMGHLIKRYKRFLVDVELEDTSEIMTAHCPNSGAMLGVLAQGNAVWLSRATNLNRKLPLTLEIIGAEGALIGVNTHRPNHIVSEAITQGRIRELAGYENLRREVPYDTNSRIDILLEGAGKLPCYVEVKNVHLKRGETAFFPDSVTARGAKHMGALSRLVARKEARAVVIYVIQREDVVQFSLAGDIDPVYAEASRMAQEQGLEIYAYTCHVSTQRIEIAQPVKIVETLL